MSKRVYYIVAIALLIGMAGLVGAQVAGTKPAGGVVVTEKEKPKELTVEQRIINLTKNQEKILADLKEIKEVQAQMMKKVDHIFQRQR